MKARVIDNKGMESIAKIGEVFEARYETEGTYFVGLKWWGSWVYVPSNRVEIIEGDE